MLIYSKNDYYIELKNPKKLKTGSIYILNEKEEIALRKYLNKNLKKEYIRYFKSLVV